MKDFDESQIEGLKALLPGILSVWIAVFAGISIFVIGLMPLWLVFSLFYWVRS